MSNRTPSPSRRASGGLTVTTTSTTNATPAWEVSASLQYPMLTRSNYFAWAIKTKVFMQAQGLWEAIDSEGPDVVDAHTDRIALAVIYQGIPDEAVLLLGEKKTAREAWEALETLHMRGDHGKQVKFKTLKRELDALRMKETESIYDFGLKVMNMVGTIRALGGEMEEAYVVKKFLRAVPARLVPAVCAIEYSRDFDTMTLEEVIGRLEDQEEMLRGWPPGHPRRVGGATRGSEAHGEAASRSNGGKSKIKCHNCSNLGHYASECRSKRGTAGEANLAETNDGDGGGA